MQAASRGERRGRPPAGVDGARTSDYRVLSVRVPEETHRLLRDLAKSLGRTRAQVIEAALPALAYTLSAEERKALETLWQVRRGAKFRSATVV